MTKRVMKFRNDNGSKMNIDINKYEPHHEKTCFCICENKDADQLHGNHAADQRLCFCYKDRTIPLLPNQKFYVCSYLLWLYSPVSVGPGRKH